jgi:hypothetical protein
MFRRLRYAAQVIRPPKQAPHTTPDVLFIEEPPGRVSRTSALIGMTLEALVLVLVASYLGEHLLRALSGGRTTLATGRVLAIVASLLSLLGWQVVERLKLAAQARLRLGERIAPYFGHKLEEARRVLRS